MKLKDFVPPYLDEVLLTSDGASLEILREGKWISGRFNQNIRIDQPTHLHGDGKTHAHVYGRKGDEIGVVNVDGSPSHGTQVRIHDRDASALRARGFSIPPTNIVEWLRLRERRQVLLG